ncbi:MAG: type II toxin-antitoxin system HicB family antitoxin [Chloroflexota bacterium]|nr:type II toxin-antitoxin system HicB family antitoxin [Chloroflexota bacterium]
MGRGEDFGYVAHCPAILGCHSQGNTMEEAIGNARDAIRGCLSTLTEGLISAGKGLTYIEVTD